MAIRTLFHCAAVVLLVAAAPAVGSAQVLGTFPWQMQPYCNVVTLALTNTPAGGWVLDGNDDQCGIVSRASAIGVATFNGGGNVTLSFSIVTAPSGKPVHVSAVVSPTTGSGTWTDSVGNSGTFAFFGATPGLPVRPLPASGLAPSSVTTLEIAAGSVGASDINAAEVQTRVTGSCPPGQAMTGIAANGTATCTAAAVDFKVKDHAVTSAPSGSTVVVIWGTTPTYNTGGGTYDAGTGSYTVPRAGVYLVTAVVRWQAFGASTGQKCVVTLVNSTSSNDGAVCEAPSTTSPFQLQQLTNVLSLNAGDVVRIGANQGTGMTRSVGPGNALDTFFAVSVLR